jgi:hypothetical protein
VVVTASVRVDTVTFTDELDVERVALEVLSGHGGYGSLPNDRAPIEWIFRALPELAGTPYADRLCRAVAACLTDPDPFVRGQALLFFDVRPLAAGGERITELAGGDLTLFTGVPDEVGTAGDLERRLFAALGSRLAHVADDAAVEIARAEALRPGRAAPVIGGLFDRDQAWVTGHADAIVRGTPSTGVGLLIAVQRAGSPGLAEFGRRIAPLCHDDPDFERDVNRWIDDPAARRAILDAVLTG